MTVAVTGTPEVYVDGEVDAPEWDAFVRRTEGGTFAHLSAWGPVFRDMGHSTTYLTARSGNEIVGVLPLVKFTTLLFGSRYVSVPYLNDGGPIGSPAGVEALLKHACQLAERAAVTMQLRTRVQRTSAATASRKVTVLLPVPDTPDELWSKLPSKLRSQVRRPQKAGLTVRFGHTELASFYSVWSHNMRDLGTPVLPRRFFDAALAALPSECLVGCVYSGDQPVAAGAGFLFRGEFEMTWASSLRAWNRDAPNMLLYWEFMAQAIERGASTFNFGRCTAGEGTHRFKLQWGGDTVPLQWIETGSAAGDGQPSSLARAVSTAWTRLPLPLSRVLGPVVARQLPWW